MSTDIVPTTPAADPPRKLTPRQEKFVEAYCQTQCIRTAATIAGMGKGNSTPYRLYHEIHIQAAIRELHEYTLGLLGVTRARVMREQAAIGFFDPRTIMDESNSLLPFKQWPDAAAAALQGMDVVVVGSNPDDGAVTTIVKPRFHSKAAALDAMAKHLGAYEADHKQAAEALGDALGEAITESIEAVTEKMRAYVGAKTEKTAL